MRSFRFVTVTGVAAGLVGLAALAVAATTQPASTAGHGGGIPVRQPIATAAGSGGGPVLYPGLVSSHFDRSRADIANAASHIDVNEPVHAMRAVDSARLQIGAAWTGTHYIISTTPPPPPAPEDLRANGDGGAAGYAAPPDTALGFFTLQHDVAAGAGGLLSTRPVLNTHLVQLLQANARVRDTAVAYIHAFEPTPPPPPPEDAAGASGAEGGATFAAMMPSVLPLLDDELVMLRGTLATNQSILPANVVSALKALITRVTATEKTINTFWPPLPPED